jgi:hypothetical protein
MKKLCVIAILICLLLTSCFTTGPTVPANDMILKFQEDTGISIASPLRALYSFPGKYNAELMNLIINNKVNLFYDSSIIGIGKYEPNEIGGINIYFGKLPNDLNDDNKSIYATGVLVCMYTLSKGDNALKEGF